MTEIQTQNIVWIEPHQETTVSVPATSANLGPGYDSMGLALDVAEKVVFSTFEPSHPDRLLSDDEDSGEMIVDIIGGEDLDIQIPRNSEHLIASSMLKFWEHVSKLAGVSILCSGIRVQSQYLIPLSRGLGSSAAAIVSGVVAAARLLPQELQVYQKEAFNVACQIEGHPDNIAPAFFGGVTISWTNPPGQRQNLSSELDSRFITDDEPYSVVRFLPDDNITPVVATPDFQASTSQARKVLPQDISHSDAANNSAYAALMVYSLLNNSPYLWSASQDHLHQSYRAGIMPESAVLVKALRDHNIPAVISGAGPTVLAFGSSADSGQEIENLMRDVTSNLSSYVHDNDLSLRADTGWKIFATSVDTNGVQVCP